MFPAFLPGIEEHCIAAALFSASGRLGSNHDILHAEGCMSAR